VLEEFAAPPNGIYAVFPQRKHLPLRVRLWIDFLKHHTASRSSGADGARPDVCIQPVPEESLAMTLEALLAYAHLLAIFTMVVFISERGGAVPREWLNAAVVERLGKIDMVYGIAAIAVLVTGIARTWWGVKGTAWYWTNPLLHVKLQALASFSHFLMKLFLAAPASGLPFLSMALAAQAGAAAALVSFSHFLMELALAAPARGLPFLSMALASQVAPAAGAAAAGAAAAGATAGAGALSCACAAPKERQAPRATRERNFFMVICPCKVEL
jgi:uncharacterized membrane protein